MNAPGSKWRPVNQDLFAVMVALADGEQTGREIQSRVIGDTVGSYIRDSSVYSYLHKLEGLGLAESRDSYFKLTDKGWHRLRVDTKTFESLVQHAKQRVIGSGHGRW